MAVDVERGGAGDPQGTENLLRYLSLHDNQYVRYFRGHTAPVTGITVSPKNDLFMSAAQARTQVSCPFGKAHRGSTASRYPEVVAFPFSSFQSAHISGHICDDGTKARKVC